MRGAFAPVEAVLSSHEGCRSGVCGSRIACLGPGREGMGITSLGRDARGLTFSAVIPARVQQPGVSTRGKQNWRIALCGYGMTLAPRHRVHCCVSHRWRTSAVHTGSGDPWPDSVGGRESGWLPGLPSTSRYVPFQLAVARWSACSRTCRNPVSAMIHRLPHCRCHRDRCAPGAAVPGRGHRSRSPYSGSGDHPCGAIGDHGASAAPAVVPGAGDPTRHLPDPVAQPAGPKFSVQRLLGLAAAQILPLAKPQRPR